MNLLDIGLHQQTFFLIVAVILFNVFAKWLLQALHKRFESQKRIWEDSFVQALYLPLIFFAWTFTLFYILNAFLPDFIGPYLINIIRVLAIFSAAWFIMRWKNLLIQLITKSKGKHSIERAKIDVIDKLITIIVVFLSILFFLEATGNNVNTLIAFGGIGGLAIAFASQEIIANYFSGLMIYTTRPFIIGDWIKLPEKEVEGHVEEIGWYTTKIRTFDKQPIYVPNSVFSKMIVVTPSRMSHRHIKLTLHLRYQDAKHVPAIIKDIDEMLQEHKAIDTDQKIQVNLDSFGSYALEIDVSAYTLAIEGPEFAEIKQDVLLRVLKIVHKHGSEVAVPLGK